MPLGTEIGLGAGDIVLDGEQAPHGKDAEGPRFLAHFALLGRSPISATAELLLFKQFGILKSVGLGNMYCMGV